MAAYSPKCHWMTPKHKAFCLEYLRRSFNATKAYQAVYPKAKATTAADAGYTLLRKPEIRAYLNRALERHWKGLQMDGDEALARIHPHARGDLRMMVDEKGLRLRIEEWPDELANSAESISFDESGQVKHVRLVSKLQARRTIMEQRGKLKSVGDGLDALAEAIRADLSRGTPKSS